MGVMDDAQKWQHRHLNCSDHKNWLQSKVIHTLT